MTYKQAKRAAGWVAYVVFCVLGGYYCGLWLAMGLLKLQEVL